MSNFKKRFFVSAGVLLLLLAILFIRWYAAGDQTFYLYDYGEPGSDWAAPELNTETEYVQTIPCMKERVRRIGFQFANYANRKNAGTVSIRVYCGGQLIGARDLDAALIGDGEYIYVELTAAPQLGDGMEIHMTSSSTPGEGVTVFGRSHSNLASMGALFTVGGVPQETLINIAFAYREAFGAHALLILAGICVLLLLMTGVSQEKREYLTLFLAGIAILFLRSVYTLTVPDLYAEDGIWSAWLNRGGFFQTALYYRPDYPILGNVVLLQLAHLLNELAYGKSWNHLPEFIALVQYAFFSAVALLPVCVFRGDMPKKLRLLCWLLILLVPVGESGYEIWGKILNTGYLFYVLAFCLIYERVFHCNELSRFRVVCIDVIVFICCGTHEGCYLLAMLGFVLSLCFELREYGPELTLGGKLRLWLGRFRNRMWIVLGLCCAALAYFDLFVLTGSVYEESGIAGMENILEFVIRGLLFPLVYAFYHSLTDGIAAALIVVSVIGIVALYSAGHLERSEKEKLSALLLGTLLYFGITVAARGWMLFSHLSQYQTTCPDRYYYGTNMMSILSLLYIVSLLWRRGNKCKMVGALLTACLVLNLCVSLPELFAYDISNKPAHQEPFSQRLRDFSWNENGTGRVLISPTPWEIDIDIDIDILIASLWE